MASRPVEACVAEARRATSHGICSLPVGDVGVLAMLSKLRAAGRLPPDLTFKTSAILAPANPATAALYERLGANTINVATDREVPMVVAMRAATHLPARPLRRGPG